MLAGVQNILIITTPHEQSAFQQLLGDGSQFGINLQYAVQPKPAGLAQALIIAETFLEGDSCLMILGDNLFHGAGLGQQLANSLPESGAHIFAYEVANPSSYGVLELSDLGKPLSVVEKPEHFISNLAVTGLYFFDSNSSSIASELTPSARGELEITGVINKYLLNDSLTYTLLSRGTVWLDTGTPATLADAAYYIRIIEDRTGLKIGCPEEIGFRNGWVSETMLRNIIKHYKRNDYSNYLNSLL